MRRGAMTAAGYCAEQVRRRDRDRYLTCLFAPAGRRDDLLALYAFNLEIAKTAEVVSEAMIGRIRLQWWREAIAEIHQGQPRAHEVVAALARAVRAHRLTRGHLERLIDAREADLDDWQPASLAEMEAYAGDTSAPLISLALEILGQGGAAAQAAAPSLGTAWAMTGLLRAVPFHARRKRIRLPRDLMAAEDARPDALLALRSSPELRAVVARVAARAGEHLAAAHRQCPRPPGAAQPALLLATLARRYLAILARVGYDPFDARVQRADPLAAWRLAWARVRGRL